MSTDVSIDVSVESNKSLIRRYYEEVVNSCDLERVAEFVSPDYEEVYNNVRHKVGIDGAKEHLTGVRKTYPDLHLTIERQIAEGEWVVTQITARGTHKGVWLGMRPTGKKVEISGVNIDRVVDGLIVEHGGAANTFEALLEIGAIKIADPVEE